MKRLFFCTSILALASLFIGQVMAANTPTINTVRQKVKLAKSFGTNSEGRAGLYTIITDEDGNGTEEAERFFGGSENTKAILVGFFYSGEGFINGDADQWYLDDVTKWYIDNLQEATSLVKSIYKKLSDRGEVKPIYLNKDENRKKVAFYNAIILKQFCDLTNEQVQTYYSLEGGRGHEETLQSFQKILAYIIPSDVKMEVCPENKRVAVTGRTKNPKGRGLDESGNTMMDRSSEDDLLVVDGEEINPARKFRGQFDLKITKNAYWPSCSLLRLANTCFLPDAANPDKIYSKEKLILDPGHDDSKSSKRNNHRNNPFVHEGHFNIVTSLMIEDMFQECLNVMDENVELSRWPGETRFGQYENGRGIGVIESSARDDWYARTKTMDQLLGLDTNSVVLSIHHNAGGGNRTEAFIGEDANQRTRTLAKRIVKETVAATAKYYLRRPTPGKVLTDTEYFNYTLIILSANYGNDDTDKILIENFFMDGQIGRSFRKNHFKKFQVKKVIYNDGPSSTPNSTKVVATYGASALLRDAAIGNVNGLAKNYLCK